MEQLTYEFTVKGRDRSTLKREAVTVGVVSSGNLEVLVRKAALNGGCSVTVNTAAEGFKSIWDAVLADFVERQQPTDLDIEINDYAANPEVVSLRLDQAMEMMRSGAEDEV